MKASELKIGNYVQYEEQNPYAIEDGKDIDAAEIFHPILLTEEWLLKFGFEKVKRGYVMGIHDRIFSGLMKFQFDRFLQMWVFSVGEYKDITRIQYVHQLQNLYFALTGNELEITKEDGKE